MTELHRPVVLDPTIHDRVGFDSGAPVLDEWLRRYAGQNRRRDTAATWVITEPSGLVMAYASVAMTGLDRSAVPDVVGRHAPDPVPALLLARLAVDRRVAGQGVGTSLVSHVLAVAMELNAKAAFRVVVVNALGPAARTWWERIGFRPLDADDTDALDLFMLTADLEATLRSL